MVVENPKFSKVIASRDNRKDKVVTESENNQLPQNPIS